MTQTETAWTIFLNTTDPAKWKGDEARLARAEIGKPVPWESSVQQAINEQAKLRDLYKLDAQIEAYAMHKAQKHRAA